MTKEEIFQSYKQFMAVWSDDKNGRYRSYDHCRKIFLENYDNPGRDIDLIALNLYAYLASWGMLRGSSFLLQKDYKYLIPIVEILYDFRYYKLLNYNPEEGYMQEYIGLVMKLGQEISAYLGGTEYYKIDKITKDDNKETVPNDKDYSLTLISKILMGTLGCTPAVDRFDMATLSLLDSKGRKTYRFNKSTFELIWKITEEHYEELKAARREILETYKVDYPIFKVLDMCLWQSGRYFT